VENPSSDAEYRTALKMLRLARDLAATPRWHWQKRTRLKRQLASVPEALSTGTEQVVARAADQGTGTAEAPRQP
jgi:hypothetical protein